MSKHVFRSLKVLVPIVFVASLVGFGPVGHAQDPVNQNAKPDSGKQTGSAPLPQDKTPANSKAKAKPIVETNPADQVATPPTDQTKQSATPGTENSTGTNMPGSKRRARRAGTSAASAETTGMAAVATAATEQADLSGTYTGVLDCAAAGVTGDTTLTVTGNQFTLADGKSGRITAAKTSGYTAVAMQFGGTTSDTGQPANTPPTIISMRAKKSGDRLTLSPIAEATQQCSFVPASATARNRSRRSRQSASTPTGAETANPAKVPASATEPSASVEIVAPNPAAGPIPPSNPVRQGGATKSKKASKNPTAKPAVNANSEQNTTVSPPSANPTTSPSPKP